MASNASDFSQTIAALHGWIVEQNEPIQLRPAAPDDLAWLAASGYPADVQSFFTAAEPSADLESDGVFLVSIARLRDTATNTVPSVNVMPLGFLPIAKTTSGDVYCLDTQGQTDEGEVPIRIVPHDRFSTPVEGATVRAASPQLAASFEEFLLRFAEGELPYDHSQARWFV